MAFDTHAAVKALTRAGASEELAVAVSQAAAAERGRELVTRADMQAEIAALQARARLTSHRRRPRSSRNLPIRGQKDTPTARTRTYSSRPRAAAASCGGGSEGG